MEKLRCVKADDIMKNMLIHALREVFREEKEKGLPTEVTRDLVLKLADHEESKLFLSDEEYQKAVQALNMLRNIYISNGRYADGIDTVLLKIMHARYRRCAVR